MESSARPELLVRAVRTAEAAGFESVWAGEHVILPDPQVPPSPMAPRDPALDSLLALTWAAAHSNTLRLGTGIVILPQRNPVVLAKEVTSLDVLSGGRVIFGIGAGYLEPEFRAVGANFDARGGIPGRAATRARGARDHGDTEGPPHTRARRRLRRGRRRSGRSTPSRRNA